MDRRRPLRASERDARNFLITIETRDPLIRSAERGTTWLIVFSPRYAPGEPEKFHGATVYGRRLFYIVRIADGTIARSGDLMKELRKQ